MPLQMFMKIDGVSGESKHFQHKGWSDVHSWNWGMTSNRKSTEALNGEDKTSLNEISIIKHIGADSAAIRLLFAQGKVIPKVELGIIPIVGQREVQTKYVTLKMEDVMIKSIVTGGGVDDKFFKEHIVLLFGRIRFEYTQGVAIGQGQTTAVPEDFNFGWNVPSNAQWTQ